MLNESPLVSCLLASNRPHMMAAAQAEFEYQLEQVPNMELLTETGDQLHGEKMNLMVQRARGKYVVVQDDDDAYRWNRVLHLILPMMKDPNIDCVGTSLVYYVDERVDRAWLYDNATLPKSMFWMGAPAYRRTAYDKYGPWQNLKCGADLHFLRKIPREKVLDLRDPRLMICRIHAENAAGKQPHPPAWTEIDWKELPIL
jgi:hypothetical protein